MAEPVGGPVTFAYDGTGRRATKESGGDTTRYVWDFKKLLQEADGGTGATETQYLSTESEYGDLVSGYGSGASKYYGFDALGSTEVLLDDTGSVSAKFEYCAFGITNETSGAGGESPGLALPAPLPSELGGGTSASTGEPFAYVGRQSYYRDTELDLYILGMGGGTTDSAGGNIYDVRIIQYLKPDPIKEQSGQTNWYLYCGNDPVNKTDPSGNRILVRYDTAVHCNVTGKDFSWPADILRDELYYTYKTWQPAETIRFTLGTDVRRQGSDETFLHTYRPLDIYDVLPVETWGRIAAKQGGPLALWFYERFGEALEGDYAISGVKLPGPNAFGYSYGLNWDKLGTGTTFARVADFVREVGGWIGDISSRVLEGVIAVAQVSLARIGQLTGLPIAAFLNAIELLGQYGSQFATRASQLPRIYSRVCDVERNSSSRTSASTSRTAWSSGWVRLGSC